MSTTEIVRFTVYALLDPETREPRYVGVTRQRPSRRARQHLTEAIPHGEIGPPVHRWLQAAHRAGAAPPIVRVLATCSVPHDRVPWIHPPGLAAAMEQSWISYLSKRHQLLNVDVWKPGWQGRKVERLARAGLPIPADLQPFDSRFWLYTRRTG